jgi:hypothetical protein
LSRRKPKPFRPSHSLLDVMLASPTQPMPTAKAWYQLDVMWAGINAIQHEQAPHKNHWNACTDAANMVETLIVQGHVQDPGGSLKLGIDALANAAKRKHAGGAIRLDGPGIVAVRGLVEDYAEFLKHLPERTIVAAHRATEQRINAIRRGQRQQHDIEVVSL